MSTLQAEFDYGVPQFQVLYLPLLIMIGAGFTLLAARMALGRWGAVKVTGVYLVPAGVHRRRHRRGDAPHRPPLPPLPRLRPRGGGRGLVARDRAAAAPGHGRRGPGGHRRPGDRAGLGQRVGVRGVDTAAGVAGHQDRPAGPGRRHRRRPARHRPGRGPGARPPRPAGGAARPSPASRCSGCWPSPSPGTSARSSATVKLQQVGSLASVEVTLDPPDAATRATAFAVSSWQGGSETVQSDLKDVGNGRYVASRPMPGDRQVEDDGQPAAGQRGHGRARLPPRRPGRSAPPRCRPARPDRAASCATPQSLLREVRPGPANAAVAAYTGLAVLVAIWIAAHRGRRPSGAAGGPDRAPHAVAAATYPPPAAMAAPPLSAYRRRTATGSDSQIAHSQDTGPLAISRSMRKNFPPASDRGPGGRGPHHVGVDRRHGRPGPGPVAGRPGRLPS